MKKFKKTFPEAVSRMFPTIESYEEFKNCNESDCETVEMIAENLILYAYEFNYINKKNKKELKKWIKILSVSHKISFKKNILFEDVIKNIVQNSSVNNFVDWLNNVSEKLGFPKVQASMISRLKKINHFKTSRQQFLLRLISFWIGLKRSHLPYNYFTFTESLENNEIITDENEGVRIDISFNKDFHIIDFEMIEWLKNELNQCIIDMNFFSVLGNRISFPSTTTASLKIHKYKGDSLEPHLYSQAIRYAIMITHQIILRWSVSPTNKKNTPLVIGIAAGKYSELSSELRTMINVKLPDNFIVRLTDYAKLCACLTDAKIVFYSKPSINITDTNVYFSFWTIKYFWFLYYDFVPIMFTNKMIPSDVDTYAQFNQMINFPEKSTMDSIGTNILLLIRKNPKNELLIIETSKLFLSKRMFTPANQILNIIFASNPYNTVARTLRMLIFLNIAMTQNNYTLFELFFDRAIKESEFIINYCEQDEEFWCEYGLLHWTRAIFILRQLRKKIITGIDEREKFKNIILSDLKESEGCFEKAMLFSPTVNRPGFWIVHLKSLYNLIKHNKSITETTKPITDPDGIYGIESLKFFVSIGWVDSEIFYIKDNKEKVKYLDLFIERMTNSILIYDGTVNLRIYKPNVAYSIATVLWDFSPIMTVGIAKKTLAWLEKALKYANDLSNSKLGAFSIVSWYSQIQKPEHFSKCVSLAVNKVRKIISKYLDEENEFIIELTELEGFKLFPLFFDEEIEDKVLI
jgi:hypothetical protein